MIFVDECGPKLNPAPPARHLRAPLICAVLVASAAPSWAANTCDYYDYYCHAYISKRPVQQISQETPVWCWAASLSMLFQYYGHPVDQARIVATFFGAPVETTASPALLTRALNMVWTDDNGKRFLVTSRVTDYLGGTGYSVSAADVVSALASENPVFYGDTDHAMILVDVDYLPYPGQPEIYDGIVMDPWPLNPSPRPLTYQDLPAEFFAIATISELSNGAQIVAPVPGSTLTGTNVTFSWQNVSAQSYRLQIGSTGTGSSNLYSSQSLVSLSAVVSGLPSDGRTLYVRLTSFFGSTPSTFDATYKAYTAPASPPPLISSIVNAASNLFPGLPNSAIAQGAMFVIYGTNLGPSTLQEVKGYPLPINLGGTSVEITVAGRTANAILYYTSATQLAAIAPSNSPTGTGTVSVQYEGRASVSEPITIVANNIGVYAAAESGSGRAIATRADYSVITPTNSPNPGDTITFWATGLGPIPGSDADQPTSSNMAGVPLEVYVGNKAAQVPYRGRNACCASLDQINVQLPSGVTGCVVPVVMQIGALVSNTTTIPIAGSGRTCTPTFPVVSVADVAGVVARGSSKTATVTLIRTTATNYSGTPAQPGAVQTVSADSGYASFVQQNYSTSPFKGVLAVDTLFDIATFGSCLVSTASDAVAPLPPYDISFSFLDAGAQLSVSGPAGAKALMKQGYGYFGQLAATAAFLSPGNYSVSGSGGTGAGAFVDKVSVPSALNWLEGSSAGSIDRNAGITLTWSGGDPDGYVVINGTNSSVFATTNVSAAFTCIARTTQGSFTVPPSVLLALPATAPASSNFGTLGMSAMAAPSRFQAPNLDWGVVLAEMAIAKQVTYR